MINYEEMKKAVNNMKKKEFEESLTVGSKRRFPGVNGYSTNDILKEYNYINDLIGDNAYMWESLGKCFSLGDLRESIRRDITKYTKDLFDDAVKFIGVSSWDLPSAYALIANYIEKNA